MRSGASVRRSADSKRTARAQTRAGPLMVNYGLIPTSRERQHKGVGRCGGRIGCCSPRTRASLPRRPSPWGEPQIRSPVRLQADSAQQGEGDLAGGVPACRWREQKRCKTTPGHTGSSPASCARYMLVTAFGLQLHAVVEVDSRDRNTLERLYRYLRVRASASTRSLLRRCRATYAPASLSEPPPSHFISLNRDHELL